MKWWDWFRDTTIIGSTEFLTGLDYRAFLFMSNYLSMHCILADPLTTPLWEFHLNSCLPRLLFQKRRKRMYGQRFKQEDSVSLSSCTTHVPGFQKDGTHIKIRTFNSLFAKNEAILKRSEIPTVFLISKANFGSRIATFTLQRELLNKILEHDSLFHGASRACNIYMLFRLPAKSKSNWRTPHSKCAKGGHKSDGRLSAIHDVSHLWLTISSSGVLHELFEFTTKSFSGTTIKTIKFTVSWKTVWVHSKFSWYKRTAILGKHSRTVKSWPWMKI